MARKPVNTRLNASTIDIINVIRNNASYEYQNLVPKISTEEEVVKVGDVLQGYPVLANQFLNALINRVALTRIKTAGFYNRYADLKKGYLEYGETVEEVFVNIAKAREFSAEKAPQRELARTLPDVRSAFHVMNWRVQYPVTIQDQDLHQAFLSINGVQDLIARIVDSVYTAQEYDEFLLFKYLLIKSITKGVMYPVEIDTSDIHNAAIEFRSMSNGLTFMSKKYNSSGVTTITSKEDQYIFMDSEFNARFDVNVLSAAFNMDKADFMGRLKLIDDWTTFDNDRFRAITEGSTQIEPITDEELAIMQDVVAVLVDGEFFQIYDNNTKFTENYIASGMYWNYYLNVWKTVSYSPFSNAVVFVKQSADTALPATVEVEITAKEDSEQATMLTIEPQIDGASLVGGQYEFVQSKALTQNGIAVHKYGALIIPSDKATTEITLQMTMNGATYTASSTISASNSVGDTVTLNKG